MKFWIPPRRGSRIRSRCANSRLAITESDRLPSSQILIGLREAQMPFAKYMMQRAQEHKECLADLHLSQKQQSNIDTATKESLAEQVKLEAANNICF